MLLLQANLQVVSVDFSSATTDGADVTAAQVALIVAASSATTDGADTTAAAVGVTVAATSATTDGADTTAANVGVVVAASSATTDGADVTAASVEVVSSAVDFSSATTDGADVSVSSVSIDAVITPIVSGGGGPGTWITDSDRFLEKLRAKRKLLNVSHKQERIIKKAVRKAAKKIEEAPAGKDEGLSLVEQYARAGFGAAGYKWEPRHKVFLAETINTDAAIKQNRKLAEAQLAERQETERKRLEAQRKEADIVFLMMMIA